MMRPKFWGQREPRPNPSLKAGWPQARLLTSLRLYFPAIE